MTEAEQWIRQHSQSLGESEKAVCYVPMPLAACRRALIERGQAVHIACC